MVSSTDGVGTKLKIALLSEKNDTIGQCLVNHCINDILVLGAKPLFFLDYFATGKLNSNTFSEVISGMTKACRENDCVLIAGETAEMPGFYNEDDYDLSGTIVGVVDKKNMLSERRTKKGDYLIGLESSGLHTNGYSLARKVLLDKYSVHDYVESIDNTISNSLLAIHKSYLNIISPILNESWLHGISHVTGGGIIENTERIINSKDQVIKIDWSSWEYPSIFNLIQQSGSVPTEDMRRSFNLGIGMILVVDKNSLNLAENHLKGINEPYHLIGKIA